MSKKDTQITTERYEDPFEKLTPSQQEAVTMRLENFAHKDIAARVHRSELTVRTWFSIGGICREAYDHLKAKRTDENSERNQEIKRQLDEMMPDALLVLKRCMKRGSESAAIHVLELGGFTPVKKLQNINDDSEELKLLRDILTKHERTRKPLSAKRSAN